MSIISETVKEDVSDYELRDDPEFLYRVLRNAVETKIIEGLEQGVEPSEQDVEFLGD